MLPLTSALDDRTGSLSNRESLHGPPMHSKTNSDARLLGIVSRDTISTLAQPHTSQTRKSAVSLQERSISGSRKTTKVNKGSERNSKPPTLPAIVEWENSPISQEQNTCPPKLVPECLTSLYKSKPKTSPQTNQLLQRWPRLTKTISYPPSQTSLLKNDDTTTWRANESHLHSMCGSSCSAIVADPTIPDQCSTMVKLDASQATLETASSLPSKEKPSNPLRSPKGKSSSQLYEGGTMQAVTISRNSSLPSQGLLGCLRRACADDVQIALVSYDVPLEVISSTQLLVQVIACTVGEIDRMVFWKKNVEKKPFSFIPGFGFCGRVLKAGREVRRIRVGQMVFGLQNSHRCGALADLLIIEEDLTAKAPHCPLAIEQIAVLPHIGVMVDEVMSLCSQLHYGARILILNAHRGVGHLIMQAGAAFGLIVIAHCPTHIHDGITRCKAGGTHEVYVCDHMTTLNTMHESSFDLVIDTIGGKDIYKASRRLLSYAGNFRTCFEGLKTKLPSPHLEICHLMLERTFLKRRRNIFTKSPIMTQPNVAR
jgi:NADPH:quinone reductase-like Zn-dependent oxidoreductase